MWENSAIIQRKCLEIVYQRIVVSRNDKVTNLWKKFLIKCLHGIDKQWVFIVHEEFFNKVFGVEKGMNDHILSEKIAIARVLSSSIDWRDLYFNDKLRNFICDVIETWGLEDIKSESF